MRHIIMRRVMPSRVMRRVAGLLLPVLALLPACGTKGPLYLPTPEQQAQQQKRQEQRRQKQEQQQQAPQQDDNKQQPPGQ